ncbi:MAG: hypothetical protein AAGB31_16050, partial [Bdellovibrio sp.]
MQKNKSIKFLVASVFLQLFVSVGYGNVLGNMQTFAPNPDSLIFQNIHSSQTVSKNYFNVGFFAAYVRNEISAYTNLTNPEYVSYKDKAVTFDFIFAWGITDHLEFIYSLPGFFDQSPDSGQTNQYFISEGINGHRPGLKYNISQSKSGGFAVVGSVDFVSTEGNPYIGETATPILNAELVYDHRNTNDGYGVNIGYRKRSPGDPPSDAYFYVVEDQLIASAGYVTGLSKPWRLHAEVYGSYAVKQGDHPDSKYVSSLEVLLGAKRRFARNFWGHVGATAEVLPEGLAPDYRVYAGVNYFFGLSQKKSSASDLTPLVVTPEQIQLGVYQSQRIQVSGGKRPYTYSLSNDFGSFDQNTLEY